MNEATPAAPAADTTPPHRPRSSRGPRCRADAALRDDRQPVPIRGRRPAREGAPRPPAGPGRKIDPAEPAATDDVADAEDIDLDVLADDAEGDEAGDAEDAEPIDTSADIFEPAEGEEVTEAGQERITAFAEFAARATSRRRPTRARINWYNDLVKQEQTRLADADKAAAEVPPSRRWAARDLHVHRSRRRSAVLRTLAEGTRATPCASAGQRTAAGSHAGIRPRARRHGRSASDRATTGPHRHAQGRNRRDRRHT